MSRTDDGQFQPWNVRRMTRLESLLHVRRVWPHLPSKVHDASNLPYPRRSQDPLEIDLGVTFRPVIDRGDPR